VTRSIRGEARKGERRGVKKDLLQGVKERGQNQVLKKNQRGSDRAPGSQREKNGEKEGGGWQLEKGDSGRGGWRGGQGRGSLMTTHLRKKKTGKKISRVLKKKESEKGGHEKSSEKVKEGRNFKASEGKPVR